MGAADAVHGPEGPRGAGVAIALKLDEGLCVGSARATLPAAIPGRMNTPDPAPSASFSAIGLRPELVAATERMGFAEMTPIQRRALPPILAGHDVVAQAKTGSGKTAAFGLGLLQELDTGAGRGAPVALVLGPTRELAEQVADELRRLAQLVPNTRVLTLCGGRARRRQEAALAEGAHIVVGTPGRVAHHLRRGTLDVTGLKVLILDEADRMLDMGFVEEVAGIVDRCPPARQTLLFSATFPARIEALSAQTQRDPVAVRLDNAVSARDLRQQVVRCAQGARYETVAAVLAQHRPSSALVFCETRQDCDGLRKHLARLGASVIALHGGFEQRERDDALTLFSNGSARFLVATDVAARGLDIPELPMVVQAELAHDPQIHTHRIGRTARPRGPGPIRRPAALRARPLRDPAAAVGPQAEAAQGRRGGRPGQGRRHPSRRHRRYPARSDHLRGGRRARARPRRAEVPAGGEGEEVARAGAAAGGLSPLRGAGPSRRSPEPGHSSAAVVSAAGWSACRAARRASRFRSRPMRFWYAT